MSTLGVARRIVLLGALFATAALAETVVVPDVLLKNGSRVDFEIERVPPADDAAWVFGTWRMRFDPDRAEPDDIVFAADGTGHITGADARRLPFGYRVSGEQVTLAFSIRGRPGTIEIPLTVSDERARLTNSSGAYYTREGD